MRYMRTTAPPGGGVNAADAPAVVLDVRLRDAAAFAFPRAVALGFLGALFGVSWLGLRLSGHGLRPDMGMKEREWF